jgi:hypothetical protein
MRTFDDNKCLSQMQVVNFTTYVPTFGYLMHGILAFINVIQLNNKKYI